MTPAENTGVPVSMAAPIGVFDSGVGGLSVLRAIRQELPDEHLVYVADSANAPYGNRPIDFIEARSMAMLEFLIGRGAKAIVVACNTATVVAVARLRSQFRIPIVAMEPAIKPAVGLTRSRVIGVLATHQTLASDSVHRLCILYGGKVRILLQPCPGWVECVEGGDLLGVETRRIVQSALAPLMKAGADTLVLGCTHYAFLREAITDLVGPGVTLVDSAPAVARELARRISGHRRTSDPLSPACEQFYSTAPLDEATALLSRLWGKQVVVRPVDGGLDCD